jgi:hypothetical protein
VDDFGEVCGLAKNGRQTANLGSKVCTYFFSAYKRCELRFLVYCSRVTSRIIQNKVCVCSLHVRYRKGWPYWSMQHSMYICIHLFTKHMYVTFLDKNV